MKKEADQAGFKGRRTEPKSNPIAEISQLLFLVSYCVYKIGCLIPSEREQCSIGNQEVFLFFSLLLTHSKAKCCSLLFLGEAKFLFSLDKLSTNVLLPWYQDNNILESFHALNQPSTLQFPNYSFLEGSVFQRQLLQAQAFFSFFELATDCCGFQEAIFC